MQITMVRSPSYGFHQNASKGQQLALLHMTLIKTQGKGCESHFKITSIDGFVIFRWKSMPHESIQNSKSCDFARNTARKIFR